MDDTISRAAALKGLEDLNVASFYELNEHSKEAYTEVKAMLKSLSPVDAVEVRHGRWTPCHPLGDSTPEGYMCSVCHVGGWEKTNFCPNCGANMRGDGDD